MRVEDERARDDEGCGSPSNCFSFHCPDGAWNNEPTEMSNLPALSGPMMGDVAGRREREKAERAALDARSL